MPVAFRAKGANGTTTYALPSGWQAGDLHLWYVETANDATVPSPPAGWAEVPGSPQGTGAAGGTTSTRLSVFYRFAQAGDGSATLSGTYNHNIGFILGFSGVDPTTPFDVTPAGDVEASAVTGVTYPGVTTTTDGAMIVFAATSQIDTSTQQITAATFAGLASVSGPEWYQITFGNGGGVYVFYGVKTAAGATGTGSSTAATATTQGRLTIPLRPEGGGPAASDLHATQAAVLTLGKEEADTRVTQAAVLTLSLEGVDLHATQVAVLTLSKEPVTLRTTQTAALVLTHETPCLQQLCQCWSIERADGTVLRFTTHDEAVALQGQIYQPCDSLAATATSGGMVASSVGDVTVKGMISADTITAADLLGGIYDGAIVEVWEQQWGDAEYGFIPRRLARGILGKVKQADAGYQAEMLSPGARLMQRPLLRPHTPACRHDLGAGLCPVDLGPLTVTGAVTSLPARQALQRSEFRMFSDSSRAEADGYFADGRITWTSGLNTGTASEVRTNAAGAFTLWAPTAYRIQVGDAYTMTPGCNKTTDDHTVKFGLNMVDFGGFPHLPGNDLMIRTPDAKA